MVIWPCVGFKPGAKFEKRKKWRILCLLDSVAVVAQQLLGAFHFKMLWFQTCFSLVPRCNHVGLAPRFERAFLFALVALQIVWSLEPAPSLCQVMPQVGSSEMKRKQSNQDMYVHEVTGSCFMFLHGIHAWVGHKACMAFMAWLGIHGVPFMAMHSHLV